MKGIDIAEISRRLVLTKKAYRAVNLALAACGAALFLCVMAVLFLMGHEPVERNRATDRPIRKPSVMQNIGPRGTYSLIAEKNIFSESRNSPVIRVVKKVKTPPVVAPPPPPPPVPRLTLIGTVLADGAQAALIDVNGQRSGHFREGDSIEGFVIKEIHKDTVLLEREGEKLRVTMTSSHASNGARQPGARQAIQGNQTADTVRKTDIPQGLLPSTSGANAGGSRPVTLNPFKARQ